jgi:hypothetical protein
VIAGDGAVERGVPIGIASNAICFLSSRLAASHRAVTRGSGLGRKGAAIATRDSLMEANDHPVLWLGWLEGPAWADPPQLPHALALEGEEGS